ncbi:pistil-specific extensin-like protein [Schistocerca americana]|uniref:pistil-specific extensin-like protein n=1 Tax=Schistocerca americana TaxID=7009 RepID=UPI001F4F636F|nr:pistil-specific extensin-like protein [Schistocerca americana]
MWTLLSLRAPCRQDDIVTIGISNTKQQFFVEAIVAYLETRYDLVRGGFQPRLPTSLPPPGQQQQPSPLPRRQPVPLMPPAQLHPGAPQVVAPAPAAPLQSPPPSELMDVDLSAGPPSQAVAVQPVLQPLSLGTPKESDTAAPCPAPTQQPSTQRQETLPLFVGPDAPSRPVPEAAPVVTDLVRGGFQPRLPTSLPPPGQQQQPSPLPRRQPVPLMPPAQLHPGAPQVVTPAPAVPLQSPPPSELMDVDPSAGPPSQAVAVQPVLQPLSLGTPKESDTAAPCPAPTQQPSTQRQETLPLFVGPDAPSRPVPEAAKQGHKVEVCQSSSLMLVNHTSNDAPDSLEDDSVPPLQISYVQSVFPPLAAAITLTDPVWALVLTRNLSQWVPAQISALLGQAMEAVVLDDGSVYRK